jgi:hypothetical protein
MLPVRDADLRTRQWYLLLSHRGDRFYWVRWLSTDHEGIRLEEYQRQEPDMTTSCMTESMMGGGKRFLLQPSDVWGRVFIWHRDEPGEDRKEPSSPPDTSPITTPGGGGWETV